MNSDQIDHDQCRILLVKATYLYLAATPTDYKSCCFCSFSTAMSTKLGMVSLADSSEELAKVYSEMSDVQKEHGKELIEQLSLAKNMKVLDFGCGTATFLLCRLTVCMGSEGKVVAVDPDEAQLALARKQYLRPNLMFIEANDTNFPEDQYSMVFSSYVPHWVENKAALLKRVYQNLQGVSLDSLYLSIFQQLWSKWLT